MKDYNGFTLIEILAVVVLIGVLSLIAVPAVTQYLSGAREKTYDMAETSMINSTTNLFVDCTTDASSYNCGLFGTLDRGNHVNVPLNTLINTGYIDPIEDPASQGNFCDSDKSFVVVQNTAGENDMNSKFEYKACLYCSDYQTPDCNFERSDYSIDNPADINIEQCSNFNTHLTTNNISLPSRVYLNGQDVDTIVNPTPNTVDTTKVGTTNFIYTYSNISAITKVNVKDVTPPTVPDVVMTVNGDPYNGTTWTSSDILVKLNSTDKTKCGGTFYDGSGIKEYSYSLDLSNWINVSGDSFTYSNTYSGSIYVRSTDNAGNNSPYKDIAFIR